MAITQPFWNSISKALVVATALLFSGCVTAQGNNPTPASTPVPGLVRMAYSPTWAPDGQRIAFLFRSRKENSQEVHDILYSSLLDGSDLVKVRELRPARFKTVSWDASGENFLLTSEDTEEIYLMDKNGENFRKLSDGDSPNWHPTEARFVSTFDNTCEANDRVGGTQCQRQIRLYDVATGVLTALPIKLEREVYAPAWSSDGLKVLWLSTKTPLSKELDQRVLEYHTYNLASQSHQSVDVNPSALTFADAEWSKDRSLMVFNYLSNIHMYFFSLSQSFAITPGTDPSLSEDNTRVLYTNRLGENRADIALFDRRDNSISTVISHRSLPLE
ncbi:MAG: PD40 domain-containing protein [Candidatus Sericytochromatia bacterium]|nr:PD40 domain-containing protein [Candidatus Sericytochromatia bacterium]